MLKSLAHKPKVSYLVVWCSIGVKRRIRRTSLDFSGIATSHEERQIRGCLSTLETDYHGSTSLGLFAHGMSRSEHENYPHKLVWPVHA
jgi:hypothetical protein